MKKYALPLTEGFISLIFFFILLQFKNRVNINFWLYIFAIGYISNKAAAWGRKLIVLIIQLSYTK